MTRWELRRVLRDKHTEAELLFNNGWQPFAVTDTEFWYRRPVEGDAKGQAVTLNGRITSVEARS